MAATGLAGGRPKALSPADAKAAELFIKETIRKTLVDDLLFSPYPLGERHVIKVKPAFHTACWTFKPPHLIYVGDGVLKRFTGRGEVAKRYYVASYVHHELSHMKHTERDGARIKEMLRRIECPWDLFNLVEDARIERIWREKMNRPFKWAKLEEVKVSSAPSGVLFGIIQHDGVLPPGVPAEMDPDEYAKLTAKVTAYWERMSSAESTLALEPILADWLKDFPEDEKSAGARDALELAYSLMDSAEAFNEFDTNASGLDNKGGKDSNGEKAGNGQGDPESLKVESEGPGDLLQADEEPVDLHRAKALTRKFLDLFRAKTTLRLSEDPGRRLAIKNFVLGQRAFYPKKEVSAPAKKEVLLVVDCSGSMNGLPIEEGKVLLTVLNLLACQGKVSGHIVLSATVGRRSTWQRFRLPMAQQAISRIGGFADGEGLEHTIKANLALAKKADFVFVYTDGAIVDTPMDKRTLHLHGIHTWGLYVGMENRSEGLMKHFDKRLVRNTIEELVDGMVLELGYNR